MGNERDNVRGEGRFPRREGPPEAEVISVKKFVDNPTGVLAGLAESGATGYITHFGRFRAEVTAYGPDDVTVRKVGRGTPQPHHEQAQREGQRTPQRGEAGPKPATVFLYRDLVDQPGPSLNRLFEGGSIGLFSDGGKIRAQITPLAPGEVEKRVLPVIAREVAAAQRLPHVGRGSRRGAPRQGQ